MLQNYANGDQVATTVGGIESVRCISNCHMYIARNYVLYLPVQSTHITRLAKEYNFHARVAEKHA